MSTRLTRHRACIRRTKWIELSCLLCGESAATLEGGSVLRPRAASKSRRGSMAGANGSKPGPDVLYFSSRRDPPAASTSPQPSWLSPVSSEGGIVGTDSTMRARFSQWRGPGPSRCSWRAWRHPESRRYGPSRCATPCSTCRSTHGVHCSCCASWPLLRETPLRSRRGPARGQGSGLEDRAVHPEVLLRHDEM